MLFVAGALHHWQKCQRRCVFLAASLWLYLRFGELIHEGQYKQALNDDSQRLRYCAHFRLLKAGKPDAPIIDRSTRRATAACGR
jgi:hypothetical protein